MAYQNLFDEVASIGWKFLESTGRGHQVLLDYSWQLASICDLLKHTHMMVINKLEAIGKASTLPEAISVVQELSRNSLTDSFRANGLCDIFMGYGISLRHITERFQNSTEPATASPISQEEQWRWKQFCDALEERERQVAELYVNEIQALRDLAADQDLPTLQEHALQGKKVLTDQIADFDALAQRFRSQIKG